MNPSIAETSPSPKLPCAKERGATCAAPGQPAARANPLPLESTQEQLGFALGWDYARHGVAPPHPYGQEPTSLSNGLLAGRAAFGARVLPASRGVQMWLQLRLQAWLRGLSVEDIQVTPHYLDQLDVAHCPVTRAALNPRAIFSNEAAIVRVRHDAGYAGGNLALLGGKAAAAKGTVGYVGAMQLARQLENGLQGGVAGLNAAQWARMAVLCSFVECLPHTQACEIPLLVLPPNRLRLFNPAQALQVFISRQLLMPGWSLRVSRIEALVPGKAARHAFQTFFHALLPRVLEAGRNIAEHELRWAIEDAWRHPLVQQRWNAFARPLSATQCEALVLRAHAKRLGQGLIHEHKDGAATDGWRIETQGYVESIVTGRRVVRRQGGPVQRGGRELSRDTQTARQAVLPLH